MAYLVKHAGTQQHIKTALCSVIRKIENPKDTVKVIQSHLRT